MDKDENLFDDQIDEDDDLLNISLDDLDADETKDPAGGEEDDDIIDLLDLLEKGEEEDLLGLEDDTDILSDAGSETEELSPSDLELADLLPDSDASETGGHPETTSDDELGSLFLEDDTDTLTEDASKTGELSPSDLELNDLLLDSGESETDIQSEQVSDDDLDTLFSEESLEELEIETDEIDSSVDDLDAVPDKNELRDASADTIVEIDDTDDLGLDMEDLLNESNEFDQIDLMEDEVSGEPSVDDTKDDLLGDIDLGDSVEETILESDDDILGELDKELEESIVSSEGDAGESSSLEIGTAEKEDLTDNADVNFDEIDDIPLDGESLEELLSESDIEVTVKGDSLETQGAMTLGEDQVGVPGEIVSETAETPDDEEFPGDLFAEGDLMGETGEPDSEVFRNAVEDETQAVSSDESSVTDMDNIPGDISSDDFLAEETDITPSVEEFEISNDTADAFTDEAGSVEEGSPEISGEDIQDAADMRAEIAPEAGGTLPLDGLKAGDDVPAVTPQMPLISEEKVERIVRDVVGEVVERIAREVFTDVAEKVISEAIDSLKKSLESDSE